MSRQPTSVIYREEIKRIARREPFTMSEWMGAIRNRVRIAKGARRAADCDRSGRVGWLIWASHCAVRAALMMALLPGREIEAAGLADLAYELSADAGETDYARRMRLLWGAMMREASRRERGAP